MRCRLSPLFGRRYRDRAVLQLRYDALHGKLWAPPGLHRSRLFLADTLPAASEYLALFRCRLPVAHDKPGGLDPVRYVPASTLRGRSAFRRERAFRSRRLGIRRQRPGLPDGVEGLSEPILLGNDVSTPC